MAGVGKDDSAKLNKFRPMLGAPFMGSIMEISAGWSSRMLGASISWGTFVTSTKNNLPSML